MARLALQPTIDSIFGYIFGLEVQIGLLETKVDDIQTYITDVLDPRVVAIETQLPLINARIDALGVGCQYAKITVNYVDLSTGFDFPLGTIVTVGKLVVITSLYFDFIAQAGSGVTGFFGLDFYYGPGGVASNLIWQIPAADLPWGAGGFSAYQTGIRASTSDRNSWDIANNNTIYGQDVYVRPTGLLSGGLGDELLEINIWYQIFSP